MPTSLVHSYDVFESMTCDFVGKCCTGRAICALNLIDKLYDYIRRYTREGGYNDDVILASIEEN